MLVVLGREARSPSTDHSVTLDGAGVVSEGFLLVASFAK
jgi:hypothetical protein